MKKTKKSTKRKAHKEITQREMKHLSGGKALIGRCPVCHLAACRCR